MFSRRLQILLDEPRYRRLQAAAQERKASVGALVREAIDQAYPVDDARRRAAAKAILSAPRIPEMSVADLKRELDEIRGGRL